MVGPSWDLGSSLLPGAQQFSQVQSAPRATGSRPEKCSQGLQRKQEVAAQLPAPATVRSPQAPVSSSGCVPAGGGWGGGSRRRACCLPAWLCCGLLSLARCLSQPTSQEFTPEPKRQACESPSAPPATAPSPSSAPRLKGAAPRQQGRPGQGARSQPGQLSWTRRAPSGKCSCLVSCPGWPHAGPWRGCGIWDSAWTSRS